MNSNLLNLYNDLDNQIITNKEIENSQGEFFQTNIGKFVNEGINIGLKTLLPDYIEEDIIDIKDTLINNGFKDALNELINKSIKTGKEIIGIFTGDIKDVNKIKEIFKEGQIINKISDLIDYALEKAKDKGLINSKIATVIKGGKTAILNIIDDRIKNECNVQEETFEKINNNIKNWYKAYQNQDFDVMEKEYKEINKNLKKTIDIESTIIQAHQVDNIHNLIKNNGKNFNLSQEEIEIANQLIF